ncbi:hypothetical protein [Sandarakinorhabdus sp.]|uniref:hypothetical protein n=1 Tax=Sandarakinorhabdus sp. TaxID=1916663 RepID=UPI003342491F
MSRVFRGVLDDQQLAVFKQIAAYKTGSEAAAALRIKPAEVERVVRRTCGQLGVTRRRDAAAIIARHYGWPEHGTPGQRFHQNGANCAKMASEPAPALREESEKYSYGKNVGSFHATQEQNMDKSSNLASLKIALSKASAMDLSIILRRSAILLISMMLALGAIASLLQGYDAIISS